MQILLFKLPKAFTLLNFQKSVGRVPWQTNNTLIGISYLQNCINMLQFAPVCQAAEVSVILQKIGQMANPGKVWQILAVNRSQNVVFYRVKNYSHPGLQERGCICPPQTEDKTGLELYVQARSVYRSQSRYLKNKQRYSRYPFPFW